MSVGAAVLLLATMGQAGSEPPPPVVHEQRLDDVGPVSIGGDAAKLTIVHRGLSAGSFAEVTDLNSGRTVIALVEADNGSTGNAIGRLSAGTARALGLGAGATANVRIRPAVPSPAEQAAVRSGTAVNRLDAPAPLLAALRRRLPQPAPVPKMAPAPAPIATPAPKPVPSAPARQPQRPKKPAPSVASGRWFVQVATLSDAARAATLAKSVDGVVRSAGRLYRVQAGPFATRAAAETARASIARRGFGDARTIAQD
jgi:rare lipoprotein A